jgi:hypothetical protein
MHHGHHFLVSAGEPYFDFTLNTTHVVDRIGNRSPWEQGADIANGQYHTHISNANVMYDDSQARGLLGMEYRTMGEAIKDFLVEFEARGRYSRSERRSGAKER